MCILIISSTEIRRKRLKSSSSGIRYENPEDLDLNRLRNVGILPQSYMASQLRGPRLESPPKHRYPTTTLQGITTQRTSTLSLKRRFPTTIIHGITTQGTTWIASETSVSYHNTAGHHNPEDLKLETLSPWKPQNSHRTKSRQQLLSIQYLT
jgi:hypothetical protein